jgi:S1-C subfamily serine protease
MNHTKLFSESSRAVLGFITKLSVGSKPHFPTIFGTGFFVDSTGLAVTNRHVIDIFAQLPAHPKTGESSVAAVVFFPGDDGLSWQMLVVDPIKWATLGEFTSSDRWYGESIPDIGFVQMAVREVPFLRLASEPYYLRIGMEVATIGYPMGTLPLTALGKLNQVTPFLRHGIVSSLFPFPSPFPHGFTMDIMQQGGSSGSPVLRAEDGVVVGMMSSGVIDTRTAQSESASFTYTVNTNISIAEPAHIIQKALEEFGRLHSEDVSALSTLAELRGRYPRPAAPEALTWETWINKK